VADDRASGTVPQCEASDSEALDCGTAHRNLKISGTDDILLVPDSCGAARGERGFKLHCIGNQEPLYCTGRLSVAGGRGVSAFRFSY